MTGSCFITSFPKQSNCILFPFSSISSLCLMDSYRVCPYQGSAALKWGTISLWFPPWGIRKDHKPTLSRKPQYRRLNFTRHKLIDRYCSVNFLLSWNMIIDCHNTWRPTHLRARGALWREAGSHSCEPIHHIFHKVPLSPSITPSEGGRGLSLEKKKGTLQKQQAAASITPSAWGS